VACSDGTVVTLRWSHRYRPLGIFTHRRFCKIKEQNYREQQLLQSSMSNTLAILRNNRFQIMQIVNTLSIFQNEFDVNFSTKVTMPGQSQLSNITKQLLFSLLKIRKIKPFFTQMQLLNRSYSSYWAIDKKLFHFASWFFLTLLW